MKKFISYAGLFAASLIIQWLWFTYMMPRPDKSLMDMLLASVVFIVILMLLDLAQHRRMK
ncbi:hypothetical protein ABNN70_08180 [Sporolactobacillus sp. Y61]|uniref:Uncharacterized protein n=1 Tax=Sporolactobacillus sp. Y61 TaxID=3160863 RepID=A0AAU8IBU8_9BACL